MDHVIETIQLTPTARLVVTYDESPENPRTWAEPRTGALTVESHRNRIDVEPVHDHPALLQYAYDSFFEVSPRGFVQSSPSLVLRWAHIFWPSITLEFHDGTFWWVDPEAMAENWPELEVGTPEYIGWEHRVIEWDRSEYQRWAEGDVQIVSLERLKTYRPVEPDGSVDSTDEYDFQQWETVESLGGCYLDEEQYTAQSVARDNFDLTEEETAALDPADR